MAANKPTKTNTFRLSKKEVNLFMFNLSIAVESILAHKFKSFLTALGIVFGVAAVVAMMAIGNGARQEILDQIKMVGVNNIIIVPKEAGMSIEQTGDAAIRKSSPGLTLDDVRSIREVVPNISRVCAQTTVETSAMAKGRQLPVKLTGTDYSYFELFNIRLSDGTFFGQKHQSANLPVCVIGEGLNRKLFRGEPSIGKQIKCNNEWFTVIGIYKEFEVKSELGDMGIETGSSIVYIPVETMLLRIINRSSITAAQIKSVTATQNRRSANQDDVPANASTTNTNQLDKIIVSVTDSKYLGNVRSLLDRMLYRRHNQLADYEIIIPELLLKQQQRTGEIFNLVLGAIAGISLLVGGIGIMNIMLASVMERIKEIGIRMAVGARRRDIVVQFIAEASFISLIGGFAGAMLGFTSAEMVTRFADIKTIVTLSSITVSFGISVAVGIIFGYLPAKRAAEQDPIVSLRME